MAQVLIIDDEVLLSKSLSRFLARHGHQCLTAGTAEEGLEFLGKTIPEVILLDLQLPGLSGLETLRKIRDYDPSIIVIILTAYGTVTSAVEAMKLGAYDFLRKPLDAEEVNLVVSRALDDARLKQTLRYYQEREAQQSESVLVGQCRQIRELQALVEKIATQEIKRPADFPPVLLLGETGTGKDLVGRAIHYRSKFSQQPFIEVNCSTLPRGLEEAELFGYEKGAFTDARASKRGLFEAAEGGTIFLNEIGDLSPEAQVKFLQVIEHRRLRHVGGLHDIPVNARIIAATNRNLKEAVRAGTFRADLYFRLSLLVVELPPLRERGDDVVLLAQHFLRDYAGRYRASEKRLSAEAKQALRQYNWPGNVRQLRYVLERAAFLCNSDTINEAELGLERSPMTLQIGRDSDIKIDFPSEGIDLEQVEKRLIEKALAEASGNVTEAARKLKIGREALRYRIQKFGLNLPQ